MAIGFLSLIPLLGMMHAPDAGKDNAQWLEDQLNKLSKNTERQENLFRVDKCTLHMKTRKNEKAPKSGDDVAFSLGDISKVSYQKAESVYTFQIRTKNDKTNIKFTLGDADEKVMEEIKTRLEASAASCRNTSK